VVQITLFFTPKTEAFSSDFCRIQMQISHCQNFSSKKLGVDEINIDTSKKKKILKMDSIYSSISNNYISQIDQLCPERNQKAPKGGHFWC
jgi:hypothetical protein